MISDIQVHLKERTNLLSVCASVVCNICNAKFRMAPVLLTIVNQQFHPSVFLSSFVGGVCLKGLRAAQP